MEYACAAGIGGVLYALLEILWRGYTHWSMVLAGGISLAALYWLRRRMGGTPLLLRCLAGAAVITLVELWIGCTVNLWWNMDVWDYSDMPMNLWGQICPLFSAMWFLLCWPAYWLCGRIEGFCRWLGADPGKTAGKAPRKGAEPVQYPTGYPAQHGQE